MEEFRLKLFEPHPVIKDDKPHLFYCEGVSPHTSWVSAEWYSIFLISH